MKSSTLTVRVACVLSLSFAVYYSTASSSHIPILKPVVPSFSLLSVSSSISPSVRLKKRTTSGTNKCTVSDLLSLLGTPEQASSVDAEVARQLTSCFRFLVPLSPTHRHPYSDFDPVSYPDSRRSMRQRMASGSKERRRREFEENELIWRPPVSVLELARLVADSGGNPEAIHLTLDPFVKPVPDCERSRENRCQLTRTPFCTQFINEDINLYLGFLFELIVSRGLSVGLNTSLTRYDFFHGHLFITKDSGRLGILFHAKEYPAYDKEIFPCNMGYCQKGSNVKYDDTMNMRNILWLAPLPSISSKTWSAPGVLVVLDARPDGIIYRDLIPEYVHFARTLYEDDFGHVIVDVNYLNLGEQVPSYKIFIC